MIPRDSNNVGNFLVSGICSDTSILSLNFKIIQNTDSQIIYTKNVPIQNGLTFSITIGIPAAMADYDLEIYSTRALNSVTLEKKTKQLVAGDYFIVTGQSNAAGSIDNYEVALIDDSLYGNWYCRTIGNMFRTDNVDTSFDNINDLSYRRVSSLYWAYGGKGCIGIWPMRILNTLVKQTRIPVCFLNGAVGATELSYHLASNTPSDPNKLLDTATTKTFHPYDGLFRRLHENNVKEGVKAIFWYQGESDAVLDKQLAQNYNKRFALLRKSWKLDYPNLEKIFVFQINTGCAGDNVSLIRDQQRTLSKEHDDVVVLSTVGSTFDDRDRDGCHYTIKGYSKLGENMALVVLKQLYHFNVEDKYIMGPDIKRIFYTAKDELCLQFNMDVKVQLSEHFNFQREGVAYLKDYFYKEGGATIDVASIRSDSNCVYLKMNKIGRLKTLSYLPNIFSNIPTTYMGPWILNKNNERLGALSFFEFPIEIYPNELWFNEPDELLAYPNPVTDYLELRIKNTISFTTLYLSDISGKKIMNLPTNWTETTRIYLGAFESGVYFLKAIYSGGTITKKIVLTKNGN